VILAVLVDRDPLMRHVAAAVTELGVGVVATHVDSITGLERTLGAVALTSWSPTFRHAPRSARHAGARPHAVVRAARLALGRRVHRRRQRVHPCRCDAVAQAMAPRELADAIRARIHTESKVTP
jgi:hypothetical protein